MTTLAWDGISLAADRLITADGAKAYQTTKIRRTSDGRLIGASGRAASCAMFMAWLEDQSKPRPAFQEHEDDGVHALEILPDGRVLRHERFGAVHLESKFVTAGSGSNFALAALALGRTAAEAVELACELDDSTGGPVDVLWLHPETILS